MVSSRLPGIYFETVTPPVPASLPRMDVAAFAGFLPSGPIELPFAVEDPSRFEEIFGVDLPLAWDRKRNQTQLAQTPPAVRGFFHDGGRRCWVVRLAENAMFNTWVIPGLLQSDDFGGLHAGWLRARSEGSWSDDLNVNATLLETPLPPGAMDKTGSSPTFAGLNAGDVVQLYFPATGTLSYFSVSDSRWLWFAAASSADVAACKISSPPAAQPDSVTLLGPGGDVALPFSGLCSENGEIVLHVTRDTALSVPPGSWLKIQIDQRTLFFLVEAMAAGLSTAGSPGADETASLTSTLAWWLIPDGAQAWSTNRTGIVRASTVTFELWAWPEGSPVERISDLGLASQHPRFWGLLPTDAALYAPQERPATVPYAALANDIDHPRFPLAAPVTAGFGVPLGMTALVRDDFTQGASLPGTTALQRDGLEKLSPSLFIDSRLSGSEAATLLQDAFWVQYQALNPSPPKGLYSLLSIAEPSLLSVPDAIQMGWQPATAAVQSLAAPASLQVSSPDAAGNYTVSWGGVPNAIGYRLQEAADPIFETAVTTRDAGTNQSLVLSNTPQCPAELYYRVSAYGSAEISSPWSVTARVELGMGSFLACNDRSLNPPLLQLLQERNRVILEWTVAPSTAAGVFTLETAVDPQFLSPSTLFQGNQTRFEYWKIPGASYFRVRTQTGEQSSPWSNTLGTAAAANSSFEVICDKDPSLLLNIHRAMLRMASARADMVAIMSMPLCYRRDEAAAYAALLTQYVATDNATGRMLSYGALYHPWIVMGDDTRAPSLSLRSVVPDGSVCGVIAATTLSSGAWIAPANTAIGSAVDLDPSLQDDAAEVFAASLINLISQEPEGFLVTDQSTLTNDPNLQPLNVRRLLILLRRLALREGVKYLFQNITTDLQRAVISQFEQLMQQMLQRGAFAGLSARDSYRVVADASVNPPASIDQGRFIVELRVAPSRPMRFLTVRLIQSSGALTSAEG